MTQLNAVILSGVTPAHTFRSSAGGIYNILQCAFQIGIVISTVLFGVTTAQAYTYYSGFPDDSLKLKLLVAVVLVCEVGHVLCMEAAQYQYTILDFAQPERLLLLPWPIAISFFFSGTVGAIAVYGSQRNLAVATFERQHSWVMFTLWGVSTANDLIIAATSVCQAYCGCYPHLTFNAETGVITSTTTTLTVVFFAINKNNFIGPCSPKEVTWAALYTVTARRLRNMNETTVPWSKSLPANKDAGNLLGPIASSMHSQEESRRTHLIRRWLHVGGPTGRNRDQVRVLKLNQGQENVTPKSAAPYAN
ncbi:hypothetical protein FB451DRAFT_1184118 [Mycena latifolia]|nr:hypothetical protein FB451DRAFT_1184118 [Mycena latifolia]